MKIRTVLISVILILALALTATLSACRKRETEPARSEFIKDTEEKDISIGVLADVHVMSETQAVNMTCDDYKSWEAHGQKMLGLSESILKTTVDRIIAESDFDVVLVSGDNADDGGEVSHRAVAAELARLEQAGIKVFTIPGNHDLNNKSYTYASGKAVLTDPTTETEFAEIYADFGYNSTDTLEFYKNAGKGVAASEATFSAGDNLSYVADLSDKYRLIAIDMSNYVSTYYLRDDNGSFAEAGYQVDSEGYVLVDGERYPLVENRHDGAMTSSLLAWAKEKTEQAVAAGKIPVGMMHFPLIGHLGPTVTAENSVVNDPEGVSVAETLADAGMKFIFTGHIHMQDNAIYTSKAGNKILDVNSASLCNYPCPVRCFRAKGEQAYVRTWTMDYVDETYYPSYLSAEEKSSIGKDFRAYSVNYLDDSMLAKIKNKIEIDLIYKLLSKLGVKKNGSNDAAVTALATGVYNDVIMKFLKLPLYEKDAKGGLSVESAAKSYGVSIPKSNYKDVFNLAMSFVASVYGGDEHCAKTDGRIALLEASIATAFKIIDDYDLFAKIKAINPAFATIDLSVALPDLYANGSLDVCKSNLLVGIVGSLDIPALKSLLKFDENSDPYKALEAVKSLAKTLKLEDMLFGLDVRSYFVVSAIQEKGLIRLGSLIEDCVEGKILLGLMNDSLEEGSTYAYSAGVTDSAPSDNNLSVNMTTMAYIALE